MASPSVPLQLIKLNRIVLPNEKTPAVHDRHLAVVTSGVDGRKGQSGKHAGEGLAGTPGQDGENGADAQPISATLHIDLNRRINLSQTGPSMYLSSSTLPLSDPRTSIFLSARGGHGGNGGDGGSGGNGAPGKKGRDASGIVSATDGTSGTPGGNGGNGGAGGSGGNAAPIVIAVDPHDTDLLLLLKTPPSVHSGAPGAGGKGGKGGKGGSGGKGGREHKHTETRDGKPHTTKKPGGANGADGPNGQDGMQGRDGLAGASATFSINAGSLGVFPWRYDLNICNDLQVNDWLLSGVIEPGTRCSIRYSVHNCGGMPTPQFQEVLLSAEVTSMVRPVHTTRDTPTEGENTVQVGSSTVRNAVQGEVPLPKEVQPNAIAAPRDPFYVDITDVAPATIGPPLLLQTRLYHKATLARVNQGFPLISDLATVLTVSYPVIMTPVVGHVCVLPGREAVLTWKIKNVSQQPIGLNANLSRLAATRLKHRSEDAVDWRDTRGQTLRTAEVAMGFKPSSFYPLELVEFGAAISGKITFTQSYPDPTPEDIDILSPGAEIEVKRLVLVNTPTVNQPNPLIMPGSNEQVSVADHSVVCLNTHLDLAHPMQRRLMREIQVRPFQVQVACPYLYHPGVSRTLLVVNDRTTASQLHQWRLVWAALNGVESDSVCVWNQSLYGGFSLKYAGGGEGCMGPAFGGDWRNVVLLNNLCTPGGIRTGAPEQPALDDLASDELIEGAKKYGCNVFVTGSHNGVKRDGAVIVGVGDMKEVEFKDEKELKDMAPSILFPHIWNDEKEDSAAGTQKITDGTSLPASADGDMKGFLLKEKRSSVSKVKRYFALRRAHGLLSYYESDTSKQPRASFQLGDCKLSLSNRELYIIAPERTLVLSSVNDDESITDWKKSIEEAIRYVKTGALNMDASKSTKKSSVQRNGNHDFDLDPLPGARTYCSTKVFKLITTGEKSLKARAEKVARDLASEHPETPFITVYHHIDTRGKTKPKTAGLPKVPKMSEVGAIRVYGGIELHSGRVVMDMQQTSPTTTAGAGAAAVGLHVLSSTNVYGCIKSLAFDRKVEILRAAPNNGKLHVKSALPEHSGLRVVTEAILSDLADEIAVFSYGSENVTSMIRTMTSRSSTVQSWLSRMKFLSALDRDDVFGSVHYPSAKYDECFRLTLILKIIANAIALVKIVNLGRRGIVAQTVKVVLERMENVLMNKMTSGKNAAADGKGAGKGKANSEDVVKDSAGVTLAMREKEWSHSGAPLGKQLVKPKQLIGKLRTWNGLHQAHVRTKDGEQLPVVLSWAEYEKLGGGQSTRQSLPTIRKEPGLMRTDAERLTEIEKVMRKNEPYREQVEPLFL